jgi:hypothetical protein
MQGFAEHQPVTVMVDAVRVLTQGPAAEALLGHGANFYVLRALTWSAAILGVFVPRPWPATGEANTPAGLQPAVGHRLSASECRPGMADRFAVRGVSTGRALVACIGNGEVPLARLTSSGPRVADQ